MLFARHIDHWQIDTDSQTDAIITLTGGRNRLAEAIRLLNDGKADKLFISGVSKKSSLQAIQKRNNIDIIDTEKVTLGTIAANTLGNAQESLDWIRQNNIKSIRLVTSNYHMPRSIVEFQSRNPELKIIAHPVYSNQVKKNWWTSWQTFSLIFAEYNKFLYACLRTIFEFGEN